VSGPRLGAFELDGREYRVVAAPLRGGPRLTPSESEVLALMLRGTRYVDIAKWRGRSLGTIGKQTQSAFRKLGVASRHELAALVARVERELERDA
jgi:DNA-binding NarL/FixJ family response regulator